MKWLSFALFRLPKGIFPSPVGSELLKVGQQALKECNIEKATVAYNQIPEGDKSTKLVKGFYAGIDNAKKRRDFSEEIKERSSSYQKK